jgi:hypothetical protein
MVAEIIFTNCCNVIFEQTAYAEDKSLNQMVAVLVSPEANHFLKWKAVNELKEAGHSATPELLKILKGPNTGDCHYYAIRALGFIQDSRATGILCDILLDSQQGTLRRYAAIALGQIADPRAVNALERVFKDMPDALNALVKIKSKDAIKALETYYFANSSADLKLELKSNKTVYTVGDEIELYAELTNMTECPILLNNCCEKEFSCLVFQRQDGSFVEQVDTGFIKDDIRHKGMSELIHLAPAKKQCCSFKGKLIIWTRGEKVDNEYIPTGEHFLSVNFRFLTYHIRSPGDYTIRLVLKQEADQNTRHGSVNMWTGKAVSQSICIKIAGGP